MILSLLLAYGENKKVVKNLRNKRMKIKLYVLRLSK